MFEAEKLRGILFDLHGTLIHITEQSEDRLRVGFETLASAHSDIPFERFRDVWLAWREEPAIAAKRSAMQEVLFVDRVRLALERLEIEPKSDLIHAIAEAYVGVWEAATIMDEADRQCLVELKNKYKLGLVTNFAYAPSIPRLLRKFELEGIFDAVIVSAEVGWVKPHPLVFRCAMQALNCEPDELIFVGDDLDADIAGAETVGMTPVLIDADNQHKNSECMRIHCVAELPKILEEILNI